MTKISALQDGVNLLPTDQIPVARQGVTLRVSYSGIAASFVERAEFVAAIANLQAQIYAGGGGGGGAFIARLRFNDARNSQYIAAIGA